MEGEMTIEEAIRHAEEVAQRKCDECGSQHRQLANWLKELVSLRAKLKVAEEALESGIFNLDAWVHGGRFAHTESDDEALEEMRNAIAAIRDEGGAK